MKTLDIRGKSYTLKSYDDLSGSDWRRLVMNIERVTAGSCSYVDCARSTISIVCPLAAKDARRCTDAEIIAASSTITHHLADAMQTASDIAARYATAATAIAARIRSEFELEEK